MFDRDDDLRWAAEAMRVFATVIGLVSLSCLSIVLWCHGGAIVTEIF